MKKHTLVKTIQIKENLNLVDIWRIRNLKTKRFTFRQLFIYSKKIRSFFHLQSTTRDFYKTDISTAFTSDHFPLIFTLSMNQDDARGKSLWKFNNSLALNSDFVDKMKAHIVNTQKNLDKENIKDDQARWEYLKYEIRKFSIKFSKLLSKNTKTQIFFSKKI